MQLNGNLVHVSWQQLKFGCFSLQKMLNRFVIRFLLRKDYLRQNYSVLPRHVSGFDLKSNSWKIVDIYFLK